MCFFCIIFSKSRVGQKPLNIADFDSQYLVLSRSFFKLQSLVLLFEYYCLNLWMQQNIMVMESRTSNPKHLELIAKHDWSKIPVETHKRLLNNSTASNANKELPIVHPDRDFDINILFCGFSSPSFILYHSLIDDSFILLST